jgi:hypothetical protein
MRSDDRVIARDRLIGETDAASERSHKRTNGCIPVIFKFAKTIRAMLREIFDESAYDRFLLRTGIKHSAESYKMFMRERESAMASKPRCC